MSTFYKVSSTMSVWIKSGPGKLYPNIGVLYDGDQIEVINKQGIWYEHSKGWTCSEDISGNILLTEVESAMFMSSRMMSTRSSISVGDIVNIKQSATEYTNAGTGIKIPQWVKNKSHVVSQISGNKVLLGFPSGIASWVYMSDVELVGGVTEVIPAPEPIPDFEVVEYTNSYIPDLSLTSHIVTGDAYEQGLEDNLRVKTLRGIHGIPYQFMPIADVRISDQDGSFGRKYAEKIIARMPLLLMTPGTPVFLSSFTGSERSEILKDFLKFGHTSELDELLAKDGKYYSLKFDQIGYFNHVDPMCRSAARFLGIHEEKLDGTSLDNYSWYTNTNEDIQSFLAYKGCVPFYIHSDTQVSDSFSNSTTESMLSSKTNEVSAMGRELNFLLGSTNKTFDDYTSQENIFENMENVEDFTKFALGSSNIFSSIAANLQTVISGGKLVFPEIWSDSDFSRSYDITIKLTTPDCDVFSWYLNICVPMLHLMGFVIPRQTTSNGYISPFLVRAFYKGLFNCDMGIITNMSFNKGEEGGWTKEGLPTVVEVNFTIKDLYSAMSISDSNNIKYNVMNNIILMDYLANMCGININEPDVARLINMYYTQNFENVIVDSIRKNIFGSLDQWATNAIMGLYSRL